MPGTKGIMYSYRDTQWQNICIWSGLWLNCYFKHWPQINKWCILNDGNIWLESSREHFVNILQELLILTLSHLKITQKREKKKKKSRTETVFFSLQFISRQHLKLALWIGGDKYISKVGPHWAVLNKRIQKDACLCLLLQGVRESWLLEGKTEFPVVIKSRFKCHLASDTGSHDTDVTARSWEQIWNLSRMS